MPELIAPDLAGYERLALDLAQDPARLAAVRARLLCNAAGAALFDAGRFRIGLEAAYRRMIERQRQGLPPAGFDIAAG
jgi:protein O-GlcNAc transferase